MSCESSWDNKHLVFLNCSETNCHLNGNYDDDVSVKVLYNCSFTVTSFQFSDYNVNHFLHESTSYSVVSVVIYDAGSVEWSVRVYVCMCEWNGPQKRWLTAFHCMSSCCWWYLPWPFAHRIWYCLWLIAGTVLSSLLDKFIQYRLF